MYYFDYEFRGGGGKVFALLDRETPVPGTGSVFFQAGNDGDENENKEHLLVENNIS